MSKSSTVKIANFILTAALIIAATVFTLKNGSNNISYSIADSTLTVTGPASFSYTAKYEDIASFVYLDDFDIGSPVITHTKSGGTAGFYENDLLGYYALCVRNNIHAYVLVCTEDGKECVFNYQDEAYTQKFYETMKEYFTENGYEISYTYGGNDA